MRVLIVGGAGVFGSRLARMLVRDGHAVTVAGRDLAAARAVAGALGCAALRLDRTGDLAGLAGHEVVVDASGPFQDYGADPYRLARAALGAGAHYLDLSDDAGFCAGIATLDPVARAAGLAALSGLSTLPALSGAAVAALAGPDRPRMIDVALLPGNRSPRGVSVMAAILTQAGRDVPVWRGRCWMRARGWSDPRRYALPGGLVREGWRIGAPDLWLFPARFGADSVTFRAGLELAVLRRGLRAFALLRQLTGWQGPIGPRHPVLRLARGAATALGRAGTGRGGMVVEIVAGEERRWWRLLAEGGDGPFLPGVAVRALLRRERLPVGAGPAVTVISLAEAEAAMADLEVRHETGRAPLAPLFAQVLGRDFDALPGPVRATHLTADVARWEGRASVTRGPGRWARLLAWAFGFPPATADVAVRVTKTVTPRGETWERRFGAARFRSHLAATPAGMTERFGPFTFRLGLRRRDGALDYPVVAGRFGPVPLPRRMLPVSVASETAEDGRFRFDVALHAPLTGGLMVRYRGWLVPAAGEDPARQAGRGR
ncbi:SDR family oxidoreductase [Frigidibacter sp. MR17.24]|uniref:SDR family oxidoreductase n=1 Tax=Frigidibacter sp. MR17.24 TaxID=3127345 RepID=UPI003012A336